MWHWESDTVAYFSKIPRIYSKGLCNYLSDVVKRLEIVDCPCRNPATDLLLCELNPKRDDVVQSVTISALNTTTVLSLSRVPLMTCPTQHVTHESFVCDQESVCRTLNNTETWYKNYCPLPRAMQQPYFYCGGVFRNFIPYGLVCDFRMDCHRGADEYFCVHSPCPNTMFDCGQGQCVDMTKRCNGDADCVKNTDEEACQETLGAVIIPPPALVRFELPKGMVISPLPGNDTRCPDSHFPCLAEQYCLPVYMRCNGINDCAHHEDEVGCHEFTCPGFYRCRGTDRTICVHVSDLCDGLPQCPKRDDELMCDVACPPSCACHHGAFTCTDTFDVRSFPFLRYLEARGGGLQQNDLTDNLMLVHLGVQACDLVYADVYIWKEEDWRKSSVCSIAGFLSLLSSEVSAFIICIITLDRFLVLRFPFSQIRFGATSAHVACAIIWTLGFTLALIPLLPATSHWQFYSQTGICIPLPITRADFAGHTYSFSVMIVGNLVLFVLIAVGQSLVHWSIRAAVISKQFSNMVISNDNAKSKEAVIARRLLTIVMTDFLCWFPIGLCGLLAAVDVAVPGEVNVAMAIFVLPLNSALNPFIYTLNIYLEKRQKAKELRLQKILLARIKMAQATAQS
ncbi:hypothetical protein ACOMHN_004658 [Nucella lapillus]